MTQAVVKKLQPDPHVLEFVRLIAAGASPLNAALESGVSPMAADAYLQNPGVVMALQRALMAKLVGELMPAAYKTALEGMLDPEVPPAARLKTAISIIQLANRASAQGVMKEANGSKDLADMDAGELEAAVGMLHGELKARGKLVDVEAESTT